MQIIFSPTKQMKSDAVDPAAAADLQFSTPLFSSEARMLNQRLKMLSRRELTSLMKMSDALADQSSKLIREFDEYSGQPAVFSYSGTSFQALDAASLDKESLLFAVDHLCILSGMYGLLSPLDLISPYRLEMKTALPVDHEAHLTAFWKPRITEALAERISNTRDKVIINLASGEYSKTINKKSLDCRIINFHFKDKSASGYRTVGMYAKTARGKFLRRILCDKITNPEVLKKNPTFDYEYRSELSDDENWTFIRDLYR